MTTTVDKKLEERRALDRVNDREWACEECGHRRKGDVAWVQSPEAAAEGIMDDLLCVTCNNCGHTHNYKLTAEELEEGAFTYTLGALYDRVRREHPSLTVGHDGTADVVYREALKNLKAAARCIQRTKC